MPAPQSPEEEKSPREVFEAALPQIDRIVGSAARRLALRAEEKDDFGSWVHLRMIEDDYRILRKFAGRSALSTYLTVVVQNLARDYRIREWGRWRPSAAAERLGVDAVQLEILRERDDFSSDEAIEKLRSDYGSRRSLAELRELAGRLPRRTTRRLEGGDVLDSIASDARASTGVEKGERQMMLARARRVLNRSLAELDVTDRLVLKMHYESGLRISAIARALGLKQRELYTRRDRCVRGLRRDLEAEGLEAGEVLEALGWKEAHFRLHFADDVPGEAHPDPSNLVKPEAEDDS